MVAEEGGLKRLATAHADPDMLALIRSLDQRYPPDEEAPYGAGSVVRSGESQLVQEMTDEIVGQIARDEEHRRLIEELGIRSFMTVPLLARRGILGAITFIASSDRRFGQGTSRLHRSSRGGRGRRSRTPGCMRRRRSGRRRRLSSTTSGRGCSWWTASGSCSYGTRPRGRSRASRRRTSSGRPPAGGFPAGPQSTIGFRVAGSRQPVCRRQAGDLAARHRRPRDLDSGLGRGSFPDGTVYAFRDMSRGASSARSPERLRRDDLPRASDSARRRVRRGDDATRSASSNWQRSSGSACSPWSTTRRPASAGSSTTCSG